MFIMKCFIILVESKQQSPQLFDSLTTSCNSPPDHRFEIIQPAIPCPNQDQQLHGKYLFFLNNIKICINEIMIYMKNRI